MQTPILPPCFDLTFTHRLTRLCDGRTGLRSGLPVTVRQPQLAEPTGSTQPLLDFIASNETVDRYGEILSAGGWRLEQYRRNPVFQNAHQYGDVIYTLGKALITEVRQGGESGPFLFQRVEFAVDINPMARIAYGLYRGGFLHAVSVGFIPVRWEDGTADARYRRKYLEQELLEVSAVGIPANPDALQLGLEAGAIQRADLVETLERLACSAAAPAPVKEFPAVPGAHAGASGTRDNEAQLLQLARALRQVLRRT